MDSPSPEFDPELELAEQISSYTMTDLKQLEKITLEILNHWEDMLKKAGGRMNEGTKMAVDLSMEQAKKDLALIREKMKQLDTPKQSPHGQVSDKTDEYS
jgi:hypothetical protein